MTSNITTDQIREFIELAEAVDDSHSDDCPVCSEFRRKSRTLAPALARECLSLREQVEKLTNKDDKEDEDKPSYLRKAEERADRERTYGVLDS